MSPSSVLTSFLTLGRFFNLDLFPVCHLAILFSCTLFVGKIGDDMGKALQNSIGPSVGCTSCRARVVFPVQLQTCWPGSQLSAVPNFLLLEGDLGGSVPRPAAEARLALRSLALWPPGQQRL